MWKTASFIGVGVASFAAFTVAMNMKSPLGREPATPPKASAPAKDSTAISRPAPVQTAQRKNEPAYKAVVRCLGDMDDMLDTVHDHASFAAVKPQLVSRARQHVAQAAEYPNQGMTQLSRTAAREWQNAANRHTESLTRAIEAAPEVRGFFETDIAAIMSAK